MPLVRSRTRAAIGHVVGSRLDRFGIAGKRRGPHALRHVGDITATRDMKWRLRFAGASQGRIVTIDGSRAFGGFVTSSMPEDEYRRMPGWSAASRTGGSGATFRRGAACGSRRGAP